MAEIVKVVSEGVSIAETIVRVGVAAESERALSITPVQPIPEPGFMSLNGTVVRRERLRLHRHLPMVHWTREDLFDGPLDEGFDSFE
jgi:hypothetical protein